MINNLELHLANIINHQPSLPIVVAYSGGIDSQVLLHLLAQLSDKKIINNPITVCHVNHGLSDNAQAWQQFAEQQCQQFNLRLVINTVNVQAKKQHSLEALARDARYLALQEVNLHKSLIITGHHSDDQSETFLLALKRGAGLKGLSAMKLQSALGQHVLLRPLLKIAREEIERYAQHNLLHWIEDESNRDVRFDRNFIRQQIMPLLSQRWPSINHTINRSAAHCLEGQVLLDELAEQDLTKIKLTDNSLQVSQLTHLSVARFNNLIRFFLAQHHVVMPSKEQLIQLHKQLFASQDKCPQVKVGDHFLRRFKDVLQLTAVFVDVSQWQQEINLLVDDCKITLPDNLGSLHLSNVAFGFIQATAAKAQGVIEQVAKVQSVKLAEAGQVVSVRFAHNNPKCLPDYRQHSRLLKKVLQELDIAPWQRKRIPFLYYDEVLVAAIGHFVCQPHLPKSDEVCIHLSYVI